MNDHKFQKTTTIKRAVATTSSTTTFDITKRTSKL